MSDKGTAELPTGWRIARVGEILKIRNGYAFKSTDYKEAGVPLIRQSELRGEVVDTTDAKRVDPKFLADLSGFVVREGDLLIGMSGSLGKIAEYQKKEPALQNQRTGLLLLKPGYDSKFAKLVLKLVEPQIVAEGKGVAVQNVSAKEIEACTFALPPPNEQRRIVAEIEKQFTRLDTGVTVLRRLQANLKRYRASVIEDALAVDWPKMQVSEIGEVVTGTTPSPTDDDNYGGYLPFVTPADLNAGYYLKSATRHLSSKGAALARPLPQGSVLVTCIGATIGKTGLARFPCATNQQINAFIPHDMAVSPEWAFWMFSSSSGQRQIRENASATTLPILNKTRFGMLRIPVPPLEVQAQLVAEIERRLTIADTIQKTLVRSLTRADRLRLTLLEAAFTGRLIIT